MDDGAGREESNAHVRRAGPRVSGVNELLPLRIDRFDLKQRLGAGSFGVVYEAYDRQRGATVALKKLFEFSPDTLLRFKREFRTLADVSHANLVALHELFGDGDEWFFTMDLVPGTDFLSFVRPAQLDVERLRRALGELVDGVAALHAAGKLHRDLKPLNVRVTPDGHVVVLDFGLVTELTRDRGGDSTTVGIVGSPAYMAPEQAAQEPLTEAADWYSVGAMLYEALTGQLPFGGTVIEVLLEKQMGGPVPPQQLVPDVPGDLAELCVRLLSRSPEARPPGADVMRLLGGALAPRDSGPRTAEQVAAQPFVGREAELAVLEGALAEVRSGKAATVYVTGGAQGSAQINTNVRDILPWLLARANVVHQCGANNVEGLRESARGLPPELAARYHLTAFVGPELPDVLALADVVISRSGAGTIAELTALGKAAVFVPLASSAGNEQAHNARHLQESGAAVALLGEVTPEHLRTAVEPLIADPATREAIAARARSHGMPDAAERLVDVLLDAAG